MSVQNVKAYLENIDYAWNKPSTYLVLVPGISLVLQKIQLANVLPLKHSSFSSDPKESNEEGKKFANICKWHLRGSMIQGVACMIAVKTFAIPFFSVLSLLAVYEIGNIFLKSMQNPFVFYELHSDGKIKSMNTGIAFNIF